MAKIIAIAGVVVLIGAGYWIFSKEKPLERSSQTKVILTFPRESTEEGRFISLPAIAYAPENVYPITRGQASWETLEKAAQSFFSANKADDSGWMTANFAADEQDAVREMLNDSEIRVRNKSYFVGFDYYVPRWKIPFKKGHLLIVLQFPGEQGYTVIDFKQTADGWKQTNELAYDRDMATILSASEQGKITEEVY